MGRGARVDRLRAISTLPFSVEVRPIIRSAIYGPLIAEVISLATPAVCREGRVKAEQAIWEGRVRGVTAREVLVTSM